MENNSNNDSSDFQHRTLLYVEDEMITQRLLSRFFETRFEKVLTAWDGVRFFLNMHKALFW